VTVRRPSIVDPSGPAAAAIAELWWVVMGLAIVVFAAVTALILVAAVRRRSRPVGSDRLSGEALAGGSNLLILLGGVAVPLVVIVLLQLLTITTATRVRLLDNPGEPLVIEVTGHKFWWDVTYPDHGVRIANEVRVPVGQVVRFDVTSADVIHSFWVPQLAGKIDMTPGAQTTLRLEASEPGTFRGLCTEYCGIQHARMQFVLVAMEPDEFDTWLAERRDPPPEPEGLARQGLEVFEGYECIRCHTVEGVSPYTEVGPDLTHFADRVTLAAGVLANDRDNLAGWILDPQRLKPGNRMPPTNLTGDELQALLAYLETLE
jgi:cytochrome c oxidase subunit II